MINVSILSRMFLFAFTLVCSNILQLLFNATDIIAVCRFASENSLAASFLILEEATPALNSVTEAHIQKALDELSQGRTTLMIAHRLATIRGADHIVVIENGRIEEGTLEELLARNGEFAKLYRPQMQ